MRSNYLKSTLKTAVLAVTILLLGVGAWPLPSRRST